MHTLATPVLGGSLQKQKIVSDGQNDFSYYIMYRLRPIMYIMYKKKPPTFVDDFPYCVIDYFLMINFDCKIPF